MDKKLINEDIQNMKYLFGYKPGRVISEQDIDYTTDEYVDTSEMTEDNDDLFLRRRLSTIEELIDKNIEKVNDEGGYGFSDEYEFADNIISWVVQDLTTSDYSDHDYDKLTDLIKDEFGEYILSQYVEEDFDDDDDTLFEQEEPETDRYMFFSNLEQIHRQTGILLEKDPEMISDVLENGHDWAQDHIATSKESIDQVFDFLMNEEKGDEEMDESFGNKIFESRYSDSLSVNTSIKLHRKSSKVVKNFLNSLSTEFIETKFIMISDCEYADFSDIDICNLPNLAYINLRGTENNFNEQGYDCASEEGNSFYIIE
jgi:hypothetical protein